MKGRRPGITQVGQVIDDGKTVRINGWGLTLCTAGCTCHMRPMSHTLVLIQDNARGELGLQQYRPCSCCAPWTAAELLSFARDLATIEALESGQPS